MASPAILAIRIVSDAKDAATGFTDAESRVSKLQGSVDKLRGPAMAAVGALGLVGGASIKAAADAEQSFGAVGTVFGEGADQVRAWAETADQALGLSENSYNELAASIGGSLRQAGYEQDELGAKTNDLITSAADLSSVFGGDAAEAAGAMGAALRGEFDSLERFGVFLNAAAVEAELARTGQDNLSGAALDAAKKQATHNLIMEQAGQYAGNFAAEADTAAGAQQRAAATAENAAATLGEALLPAYTALMGAAALAATYVSENSGAFLILAGVVGGLAAVVLATSAALRVYTAVTTLWSAVTKGAAVAQRVLNAAMRANPIGLIITAITLLVAGVIYAYNRFEWFRNGVQAVARAIAAGWKALVAGVKAAWSSAMAAVRAGINGARAVVSSVVSGIRSAWSSLTSSLRSAWSSAMSSIRSVVSSVRSFITSAFSGILARIRSVTSGIRSAFATAFGAVRGVINGVISTIRSLIGWIGDAISKMNPLKGVGNFIGGLFSGGYERAAVASTIPTNGAPFYLTAAGMVPRYVAPTRVRPERGGTVVNVTVNGAIDPNETARQIKRILDRDSRRDGLRPTFGGW